MKLLKEMVENMLNENETDAKVNFHSYLTNKIQNLNEDKDLDKEIKLDK